MHAMGLFPARPLAPMGRCYGNAWSCNAAKRDKDRSYAGIGLVARGGPDPAAIGWSKFHQRAAAPHATGLAEVVHRFVRNFIHSFCG